MPVTSTDALDLLEKLDIAMDTAKGGEYKAVHLAKELKKVGLELRAIEVPAPRFNMDSAE